MPKSKQASYRAQMKIKVIKCNVHSTGSSEQSRDHPSLRDYYPPTPQIAKGRAIRTMALPRQGKMSSAEQHGTNHIEKQKTKIRRKAQSRETQAERPQRPSQTGRKRQDETRDQYDLRDYYPPPQRTKELRQRARHKTIVLSCINNRTPPNANEARAEVTPPLARW